MTNDTCACGVLPFIWGWSPCVLVSLSSFAGVLVWTHLIWENIFLEEGAVPASLLVFASLPVCMAVVNNSIPCAVDFRSGMNHQWEMSTEHSEGVPGRILPKKKKKISCVYRRKRYSSWAWTLQCLYSQNTNHWRKSVKCSTDIQITPSPFNSQKYTPTPNNSADKPFL